MRTREEIGNDLPKYDEPLFGYLLHNPENRMQELILEVLLDIRDLCELR